MCRVCVKVHYDALLRLHQGQGGWSGKVRSLGEVWLRHSGAAVVIMTIALIIIIVIIIIIIIVIIVVIIIIIINSLLLLRTSSMLASPMPSLTPYSTRLTPDQQHLPSCSTATTCAP
jgi:hypothetical protein